MEKSHAEEVKKRESSHKEEFSKLSEREQKRLDSYKKNQEAVTAKIHKEFLGAQEELKSRNS